QRRPLAVDSTKLVMDALESRLPLLDAAAPRTTASETFDSKESLAAKPNARFKNFGDALRITIRHDSPCLLLKGPEILFNRQKAFVRLDKALSSCLHEKE